ARRVAARGGARAPASAVTEAPLPFTDSSFGALVQGDAFTLWHYRTADSRATATAAGYFAPVAARLRPGDLLLLQAVDSFALLPIRSGATFGTGVTLDGAVGPLAIARSVAHGLTISQAAAAVVRSVVLAPLSAIVLAGTTIPAAATVTGPISQVVFTLRDASNAVIPPARTRNVVNGQASANFAAPPIGTGYRIRVEDVADPSIASVSGSFSVGVDLQLIRQESGGMLLLEDGGALMR
ncbi:MAG: hypothetical protein K2X74_08580, partial [Acetobacteraceae bacterium]|nr:hypothetical protein [Acetobacteraceae bacterium]